MRIRTRLTFFFISALIFISMSMITTSLSISVIINETDFINVPKADVKLIFEFASLFCLVLAIISIFILFYRTSDIITSNERLTQEYIPNDNFFDR